MEIEHTADVRSKPRPQLVQVMTANLSRVRHRKLRPELPQQLNRAQRLCPQFRFQTPEKLSGGFENEYLVAHVVNISDLLSHAKNTFRQAGLTASR
jgi:hypothetical protein